jgi:hypothetical protein
MILIPARPSRPEGNVDAQDPQKRLRTPQAAGKRAGIFWASRHSPSNAPLAATGAGPQEVGGALDDGGLVVSKSRLVEPRSPAPHCKSDRRLIENIGYFGFVLPKSGLSTYSSKN